MKIQILMWLGVGSVLVLGALPVTASNTCVRDAAATVGECNAGCAENRQSAMDACLNRDHTCVEACRAGRENCVQATGLDAAVADCNATQATVVHQCRVDHLKGSPERDACIDQAQLAGFQCRKEARQVARLAMMACRTGFRACARACAVPLQPDPTLVPQCKSDARDAAKSCHADCREDLQVARDACLNRDHACVEECRLNRETCRQPVLAQLLAEIAACNAVRDSAIQDCHSRYGDGTADLALCIQDAQATAFECRDANREVAQPLLHECRESFNACARACAPPA